MARMRFEIDCEGSAFAPLAPGSCRRVIEIGAGASLQDLAEAVIGSVGFDFDHAFGFYENLDDPWGPGARHTLFADMGAAEPEEGGPVRGTRLDAVFGEGTAQLMLFDYGDEWRFRVRCTATGLPGRARKAECVTATGEAPEQYP